MGRDAVPPKDFNVESLPMIREALSRLNLARLVEQHTQQLSKSKAVTAQELEAATADLQSSQATYNNQLLQAHAAIATLLLRAEDLDSRRQQLQDTVILAPVPENPIPYATGATIYAVSARNVSEGTFARVGSEVFKLVIDDALRLRVAVPERHLGEIAVGQTGFRSRRPPTTNHFSAKSRESTQSSKPTLELLKSKFCSTTPLIA